MVKCEGVFSPHTANLKKGVLTCDSQWFNVRRATHPLAVAAQMRAGAGIHLKLRIARRSPAVIIGSMIRLLLTASWIVFASLPATAEVQPGSHADDASGDGLGPKSQTCRLLELRTYHAAPGKLDALLDRFRDHTLKLFKAHGIRSVGYWLPVDNKDNLLVFLLAYPDRDARERSWTSFAGDPEWKKAVATTEAAGKLVDRVDQRFLTQTDFSEGFAGLDAGTGHLFEMRTYSAVDGRLPNLHARFRDHTMALFRKHGMTNLAYFQPTPEQAGADNTLLYFLAHKDMDSALKSWEAFRADPVWIAAKKASEEKAGGSLTVDGGVKSMFLVPTDFSPVK